MDSILERAAKATDQEINRLRWMLGTGRWLLRARHPEERERRRTRLLQSVASHQPGKADPSVASLLRDAGGSHGVMSGWYEFTNSMNRDTSTMSRPTKRIVWAFTRVTIGR